MVSYWLYHLLFCLLNFWVMSPNHLLVKDFAHFVCFLVSCLYTELILCLQNLLVFFFIINSIVSFLLVSFFLLWKSVCRIFKSIFCNLSFFGNTLLLRYLCSFNHLGFFLVPFSASLCFVLLIKVELGKTLFSCQLLRYQNVCLFFKFFLSGYLRLL
jgi:hypothetical protein